METPSSSTKRVTRSMTLAALNNNTSGNNNIPMSRKAEDSSDKGVSKSGRRNQKQQQQLEQEDRLALLDITNDSPIVGLAMGSLKTPLSNSLAKQKSLKAKINNNNCSATPGSGSGEALLRCQVKTLLQKVEEEADLSKISIENRPFLHLQGFVNSPSGLLAPTPANTPQVPIPSLDGGITDNGLSLMTPSLPVVEEKLKICCQVVAAEMLKQGTLESQKSLSRSLLMDFSEKSEYSYSSECSSVVVTPGESECKDKASTADDDNASVWSIQVNASTHDEQVVKEDEEEGDYCYHEDEYDEGGEEYNLEIQELCEGISNVCVNEKKNVMMPRFEGKHTRFLYDSDDDEIVEVEDDRALRLKGLPTPRGKHLCFPAKDEDED